MFNSDMNLPWENAPDVEWSCLMLHGVPLLMIQASGPAVSGALLARDLKTVTLRFIFDDTKLPDFVPKTFLCYEGDDILHPILACDPEPMLFPLRAAITDKAKWILALQVMVEGKPMTKMLQVQEGKTLDSVMREGWIVQLRDK